MWDDLDNLYYLGYKYGDLFPYIGLCFTNTNPPEPPVPPVPEIEVFPYGGLVTLTTDFSQESPEWDLLHLD